MVGLTDFELFPRETAQAFFDREQEIVLTGDPMVDFEELFVVEERRTLVPDVKGVFAKSPPRIGRACGRDA
jgi:hypothetical protein